MRVLLALALSLALYGSPDPAAAGGNPAANENGGRAAIVSRRVEQLALAAIAGAGIGGVAAVVSGNAVTGATLGTFTGTLAALYVAHLFVEAIVVGGVYYFWPWESRQKSGAASGKAIKDAAPPAATLGLRLATER
ncbi:MAG TPA: hypothetical protein VGR91_07120 [Stellaceae bacterium]|nr:hypothetical protein [Stellaceae bacterium]